jgi:hypothetical protein
MTEEGERLQGLWPKSPIAGQIVLDWPRSYDVEPLGSTRPAGAREVPFPRAATAEHHKAARFVVTPFDGEPWVGAFAYPFAYRRMRGLLETTVTNGPADDWLTVAAGGKAYVVNAHDPADWVDVDVDPVMDVRASVELGLVVFADFITLTAYNAEGECWVSDRVAWDGLRIDRLDASGIYGVGWSAPANRLLPFIVDPATGVASLTPHPSS